VKVSALPSGTSAPVGAGAPTVMRTFEVAGAGAALAVPAARTAVVAARVRRRAGMVMPFKSEGGGSKGFAGAAPPWLIGIRFGRSAADQCDG